MRSGRLAFSARTLLVALICVAALFSAPAARAGETLSLGELLREAEAENPGLASMKSRYEAAMERVPQAGALDDPRLFVGLTNVTVDGLAFDREPMTMKEVGISQMFPFYGKRALKSETAAYEAAAVAAEYEDGRLMLRAEVKKAYYELYSIKKSLELVEKNMVLLDEFRNTAETRYSVGEGGMRDVLKAQVESAALIEKKLVYERERRTTLAYLGSLLGRGSPPAGEVEDIAPGAYGLDRAGLIQAAAGSRPAIKSAEERIRKGGAMVDLARKAFYPDFEFKLSYGQRDDLRGGMDQSDLVSAMVSVNLPVWWGTKLEPGVREAAAEKAMAENELDAVRNELAYKIDSLVGEVEQDDRVLKLYREVVIPQATEDLGAALAGYEVGREDFLSLLDARRMLYEYELSYYMTLAGREKAVAELEAVVGREL